MPNRLFRTAAVTVIATALSCGLAVAKDRPAKMRHDGGAAVVAVAPPLVVKKRSFLDPGNVVPVGSDSEYIAANTYEHVPIYNSFSPARFGESALPQRFDLPGNPRFNPGDGGLFD